MFYVTIHHGNSTNIYVTKKYASVYIKTKKTNERKEAKLKVNGKKKAEGKQKWRKKGKGQIPFFL